MKRIFVDGPAGSGKTTFATDLARGLGASLVHMDDLYQGWGGLDGAFARLEAEVLEPLSQGRPASFTAYNWTDPSQPGPARWIDRSPSLVVEGCGSAPRAAQGWIDTLIWMDGPVEWRHANVLERDGQDEAALIEKWERATRWHFARERTRERADILLER